MLMMLLCLLILIKEGEETDHLKWFFFQMEVLEALQC